MARLEVRLIKSPIGYKPSARATIRAMGLRRLHDAVLLDDNHSLQGMIRSVQHLVAVRPATDGDQKTTTPSVLIVPASTTESAVMAKPNGSTREKKAGSGERVKREAKAPAAVSKAVEVTESPVLEVAQPETAEGAPTAKRRPRTRAAPDSAGPSAEPEAAAEESQGDPTP